MCEVGISQEAESPSQSQVRTPNSRTPRPKAIMRKSTAPLNFGTGASITVCASDGVDNCAWASVMYGFVPGCARRRVLGGRALAVELFAESP